MKDTYLQITHDEGDVEIEREGKDAFLLTLRPRDPELFIPRKSCKTTVPVDLIRYVLSRISFAWLCDCIARHEDLESVPGVLKHQIFSYFAPREFKGKRLLDFGCGTGASSLALAAMLPETEIIGVELTAKSVEIANRIGSFRGLPNVRFLLSPSGDGLPKDGGVRLRYAQRSLRAFTAT